MAVGHGRLSRLPWWVGPASVAGAWTLKALGATWRIEHRGAEYDRRLAAGERCIFAVWHSRLFPFAYTHRGRRIAVLVSHHRDGELIARVARHMGFETARGSSTRGGEEGVRGMIEFAERRNLLGMTPDGPRGPAERVKRGLVYLASRTGWPVVPIASASRPDWVFRSWDRFRVPRPFARVVVSYGAPIPIPRDLDDDATEAWRLRVEAAIADLSANVAAAVGEAP